MSVLTDIFVFILAAFFILAYLAVRVLLWAVMFWFAAWLFPGLDTWALEHAGISFATIGAGFGVISLAFAR